MDVLPMNSPVRPQRTSNSDHLDLETIRRRVATIQNSWSTETAQQRAVEGQKRRDALESLVLDLLTDTSESEECCEVHEHCLSLVG